MQTIAIDPPLTRQQPQGTPNPGSESWIAGVAEHFRAVLDDPCSFHTLEDFLDPERRENRGAKRKPTPGSGAVKSASIRGGILRYPGGKEKVKKHLLPILLEMAEEVGHEAEYREPFLGGGGVTIPFLQGRPVERAWLNDRDPAMAALWDAVINDVDTLDVLVGLVPHAVLLDSSIDYFNSFKEDLLTIDSPEDLDRYNRGVVPIMKLSVHQMGYSGLGTAGGPKRDPLERYNSEYLSRKLRYVNRVLRGTEIRNNACSYHDFELLFSAGKAMFYLDPPYYAKGQELYQFAFSHEDHVRLSHVLRSESRPWLLSYDRDPTILDLYGGWASIQEIEVPCSINGRNTKLELLIRNK